MDAQKDRLFLPEAIREGHESAFLKLYELTKSRVFNVAWGYARNREDAEGTTQYVFIEVFRLANTFKGDANVITWNRKKKNESTTY